MYVSCSFSQLLSIKNRYDTEQNQPMDYLQNAATAFFKQSKDIN